MLFFSFEISAFDMISKEEQKFRQALNWYDHLPYNYTLQGIKVLNPDLNDFVISCIYNSRPCSPRYIYLYKQHVNGPIDKVMYSCGPVQPYYVHLYLYISIKTKRYRF